MRKENLGGQRTVRMLVACALGFSLAVGAVARAQTFPGLLDAQDNAAEDTDRQLRAGKIDEIVTPETGAEPGRLAALLRTNDERRLPEVLELTGVAQIMMAAMSVKHDPDIERALEWAQKVQERKYGPDDPRVGETMVRLGLLAATDRNHARAIQLLTQGFALQHAKLEGMSKKKEDGGDEAIFALALPMLAGELEHAGDLDSAERWARQAIAVAIGQDDVSLQGDVTNILAQIALLRGKPAEALEVYQRARELYAKKKFGGAENFGTLYSGMCIACLDEGKRDEALTYAQLAWDFDRKHLKDLLTLPEVVALKAVHTTDLYTLAAALGDPSQLADEILRYKGCVLEAAFSTRSLGVDSDALDFTSDLALWRIARQQVALLESEPPERQAENAAELEKHRQEVRHLEAALAAKGIVPRELQAGVTAVNHALGPRRALVEFLRYYHYLGSGRWERAYGAMVFAQSQAPRWVHLGGALAIDAQVEEFQKIIGNTGVNDKEGLRKSLVGLYTSVYQPIAALLPAHTDNVIISPDGKLNFLPFATLIDPQKQFVAESTRISYVTSGRDLLRPVAKPATGPFVLFGNPAFHSQHAKAAKSSGGGAIPPAKSDTTLVPLEFSAAECTHIEDVLKEHKIPCQVLLGDDASENNLANLPAPRGLHFATHGEFSARRQATDVASLASNAPEQRSVMYLAGAQDTLDSRARGNRPKLNNEGLRGPDAKLQAFMTKMMQGTKQVDAMDGIVTAQEIAKYHMEGSRLVTLSACETGLGEARSGEGVLGLRRSFLLAGAQNLLVSLWEISDERTAELMGDFYTRVADGGDIATAWADTQRDWLCKLRDAGTGDNLIDSVRTAGAFVLSRQGQPGSK